MKNKKSSLVAATAILLFSWTTPAAATPFSPLSPSASTSTAILSDDDFTPNNVTIEKRCANPCGWNGWLCCAGGQQCITDNNNQAQCVQGGGAAPTQPADGSGYWQLMTKTWVETDLITRTSVYSVWQGSTPVAAPATPTWNQATVTPYETSAPLQCNWSGGESSCGSICCSAGQYCEVSGQCADSGTTAAFSAPLRPTASTLVIQTATMPTTTTVAFIAPVPTGQNAGLTMSQSGGGGLSGGAIAGIVIGVLAALIILFFLIICLCARGIWEALVALFGGGKKKSRRKETVEYYSHHSDRHGGRRWYGDRPVRIERSQSPRRKGIGAGGIAGILGALAIGLGLKRRYDKRHEEKSEYSSDYYTYSGTSRSSSSDRRTRDTRRTRR